MFLHVTCVIIFTETWLTDDVFNTEGLFFNNYQILRYNRNSSREGTVLIAVSSLHPSEIIATHSDDIK